MSNQNQQVPATGNARPTNPRAFFTTKNGKLVYAADYGYKCWPIGKQGRSKRK